MRAFDEGIRFFFVHVFAARDVLRQCAQRRPRLRHPERSDDG